MVDPLKYSYYLVLVTEKKKKYDITNFVEDLGWEELENELAAKLSCTVKNDKTTKGRLSSLTKPDVICTCITDTRQELHMKPCVAGL